MALIDRIDASTEGLGARFAQYLPGGGEGVNFGGLIGKEGGGVNFGGLVGQQGGGVDWGAAVGQNSGGLNWGAAMGQQGGGGPGGINWGAAVGQGAQQGASLFGRYLAGYGVEGMSGFTMARQAKAERLAAAEAKKTSESGPARRVTETYDGPATADDNKTLTAESINTYIATTRAGSPLKGQGAYILQRANELGVSAPLALGIMLKESELGTTAGASKNLSGVTDPATDGGLGGVRTFVPNTTWEQAIDRTLGNLASDLYKGKSMAEQIGTWYVGPQEWGRAGMAATDKAGNGTVGDYVGLVQSVYAALGVPVNAQQGGTRRASAGSSGAVGLGSLFGGRTFGVSQDFGHTDFSTGEGAHIYDFGSEFGLDGDEHTGWDIDTPVGTNFYMPAGLSGTVTVAGRGANGGYHYTDEQVGPGDGRGELRVTLDNGYELILGHNRAINVQAGQRVSAGTLLGQTGWANGGHMHIEVRRRDTSTKSGWRIVNPAEVFGRESGGGGGNAR